MTYTLVTTPLAEQDMEDSADYYKTKREGLRDEYLKEVATCFVSIEQDPLRPRIRSFGVRRVNSKRFEFAVYYIVVGESIVVFAVQHQRRLPERWKKRIRNK